MKISNSEINKNSMYNKNSTGRKRNAQKMNKLNKTHIIPNKTEKKDPSSFDKNSNESYSFIHKDEFQNSIKSQFKTSNCFERSREEGGGVDEPGEDPETGEEDDQHSKSDVSAKQSKNVGETYQTTDFSNSIPPFRVTIKDIIENTKSGIPAKSAVLSSMLKNSDSEKQSSSCQSDVIMTTDNRSDLNCEDSESQKVEIKHQVVNSVHKRIVIVNGKPQIDQSSLVVEQSQIRREEDNPKGYKVINENENNRSSSIIYPKRSQTKKWTFEETEFFYQCLVEYGTDFSMIESKFNGKRNRTQIKNKFRKEEKENLERIDEAIIYRRVTPIKKREIKSSSKESSDNEMNSEENESQ